MSVDSGFVSGGFVSDGFANFVSDGFASFVTDGFVKVDSGLESVDFGTVSAGFVSVGSEPGPRTAALSCSTSSPSHLDTPLQTPWPWECI